MSPNLPKKKSAPVSQNIKENNYCKIKLILVLFELISIQWDWAIFVFYSDSKRQSDQIDLTIFSKAAKYTSAKMAAEKRTNALWADSLHKGVRKVKP